LSKNCNALYVYFVYIEDTLLQQGKQGVIIEMKKRLILSALICLVMALAFTNPVLALDKSISTELSDIDDSPSIRFTYIYSTSTGLNRTDTGIVSSGYIYAYPDLVDEVWIYLYLERYESGSWVVVGSKYKHFDSHRGYLEYFKAVPKGYYYRVRASYYAWSGSNYEQHTDYSGTRYYS
jgi:hypothetical protein